MTIGLSVKCLGDLTAYHERVVTAKLTNSKTLALWLYLALESNPCSRAKLAALFWGELNDAAARSNLRQTLMRLRQLLPGYIEVDKNQVAIPSSASYEIDLLDLRAQLSHESPDFEALLQARIEDLFVGLHLRNAPEADNWIDRQRETYAQLYVAGLSGSAERLARDDPALSIELYRRCLSFTPWAEEYHCALMETFMRLGDRPAALAQFETCKHALADELDAEPDAAMLTLYQAIRDRTRESVPERVDRSPDRATDRTAAQPPLRGAHGLPEIDSRLRLPTVNRLGEQQRLEELLVSESGRIVSIVGPGGAGKTHLATHAGRTLRRHFGDGVYFVPLIDLEPVDDAAFETLLLRRVLQVMAISFVPGKERAALERALSDKQLLLILDNFEKFVPARDLLATLTRHSKRVRVLVTTRHQLGLPTEWIIKIDGLDYPSPGEDAENERDFPAVELFHQVARRLDSGFNLQENMDAVVRICQAVDGYPLAIILAARWLPTLNCAEIASRLLNDLSLIRDPTGNTQPDRHRNMMAVLDYSWQLLDSAERRAFAAFSVFPGPFAVDAAQHVADCSLTTIAQLESKSLLRRAGKSSLEIHPLLRSVGAAKLAKMGDWATAVRERHAAHFMLALRRAQGEFVEHDRVESLLDISRQISDLSLAFRHFFERRPIADWAPQVTALWTVYRLQGWFREGAALLKIVLATDGLPDELRARWRLWLTEAFFQLGEHEQCRVETVAALRPHGESMIEEGRLTGTLIGEFGGLFLPFHSAGTKGQALTEDIARLHNRLAQVYFYEGDRARFVAATLRSVNLDRAGNLPAHMASAALVLSYTPFQERALRYARRAEQVISRGDRFERAWAHEQLCLYFLSRGDLQGAEHHGTVGQALYWALKQYRNWGECTSLLAMTNMLRGNLQKALDYWRQAEQKGARVQEAAAEIWGVCGTTVITLRQGGNVDLDEYQNHAPLAAKVFDPNTQLLYHGVSAWLFARAGRTELVLSELRMCQRLFREASMLSIYALNTFIGQIMALVTLTGANSDSLAPFGRAAIRQMNAFARAFPAARPMALHLRAAWVEARGQAPRARGLRRRAERLLAPGCQADAFAMGLADERNRSVRSSAITGLRDVLGPLFTRTASRKGPSDKRSASGRSR